MRPVEVVELLLVVPEGDSLRLWANAIVTLSISFRLINNSSCISGETRLVDRWQDRLITGLATVGLAELARLLCMIIWVVIDSGAMPVVGGGGIIQTGVR